MPWIELHIETTAETAESLADQLMLLGAEAVTFQDAGNQPVYELTPHVTHLWQHTTVIGLFDHQLDPAPILAMLQKQRIARLVNAFSVKNVADQDWERVCLADFKPLCFGKRLWICPSWHEPPDPHACNLILDPGLAFGTGTHPTTALCLEWLDAQVQDTPLIMDYGCGSGILALAALKLGAKKVIAVDNDPEALLATVKNSQRNQGLTSRLHVCLPQDLQMENTRADILIANILAQPLIQLAPHFAELTCPGSQLLLSGILSEQADSVMDAYRPWFQFNQPVTHKNEWVRLEGTRL